MLTNSCIFTVLYLNIFEQKGMSIKMELLMGLALGVILGWIFLPQPQGLRDMAADLAVRTPFIKRFFK